MGSEGAFALERFAAILRGMPPTQVLLAGCAVVLSLWQASGQPGGVGKSAGYSKPGDSHGSARVPAAIMDYHHTLGWISTYAGRLEKSHGARSPAIREPLEQMQADAKFLQRKWIDWSQRNPRNATYASNVKLDPYYRVLEATQRQLKEAAGRSDEAMVQTVKDLAADLHAKAENCRHSEDGLGKEIRVVVRTKRGVQEVGGYEVWCAPLALVAFKNEHIRFPQISSPTALKNLAPGCYAMWLQKDQEKTAPVKQIIGGHGDLEFPVELAVPLGSTESQ